jgi:hypothetical protein
VLELYSLSFGIHFRQQWKGILFSLILNRREVLQYHEQRVYRIIHVEGGLYLRFIAEEMINLNFVQDSFFLIPCAYQLRASLCLKLSFFTKKKLAIYLHWAYLIHENKYDMIK